MVDQAAGQTVAATPAPNPVDPSSRQVQGRRQQLLQQAQLQQVREHLPRFLLISGFSVIAACWILWDWPFASNRAIQIWAGSFLAYLFLRGVLIWSMGRVVQTTARTLATWLIVSSAINGLFWSFASIYFNPLIFPNSDLYEGIVDRQVLLAALLAAQGIAALAAYASYQRAFTVFSVSIFVPCLIHLLLHPTSTAMIVAVIGSLWWLFLLQSARFLNAMVLSALSLRLDNEALISSLRKTQTNTLQINRRLATEVNTRKLAESQLQTLNEELEERVQARTEALQSSQDSLTLAIEASGIALWDWCIREGVLRHTNLEPLLGCEKDECRDLLGEAREMVHPEDYRLVKRAIIRHLRRRTPRYEARYRVKHQRGHWVWLEDKGRVVSWDSQGKPSRMLGTRRDITREREAEETQKKLDYVSNYDRLTHLANLRQFRNRLHAAITAARDQNTQVAMLHINLDRFRQINESLGYEVGDALLREAGRRLSGLRQDIDTLARIGGDEFAIIRTRFRDDAELEKLAGEIIHALRQPYRLNDHELLLGASVGISQFPAHGRELAILINHADLAMQQAKRLGGNQSRFYSPDLRSATIEQLNLEISLRKAIFHDEFVVHYQPKVCTRTGKIVGMEALVRWQHPTLGLLHPGRFIPLAEETGMISVITERVLAQATRQVQAWTAAGLGHPCVAVNIAPQQLHKGNLIQVLQLALDDSGLAAAQLEVELTESSLMDDPELAASLLKQIRELGMSIALDDFGTGYSSLSHLRRFPLDTLKIDQAFVRELGHNSEDGAIVRAIITMAHELGMDVVAEGVETQEHLDYLRAEQCDFVQGYFLSRPVPADEMEALLKAQQASG